MYSAHKALRIVFTLKKSINIRKWFVIIFSPSLFVLWTLGGLNHYVPEQSLNIWGLHDTLPWLFSFLFLCVIYICVCTSVVKVYEPKVNARCSARSPLALLLCNSLSNGTWSLLFWIILAGWSASKSYWYSCLNSTGSLPPTARAIGLHDHA